MDEVLTNGDIGEQGMRALNYAVNSGQLSGNSASPRWAGRFRYVGQEEQDGATLHRFEHIRTKHPIFVKVRV